MKEIERILNLKPENRTDEDIKYLLDHAEELTEDQVKQLNSESSFQHIEVDNAKIVQQGEDTLLFSKPLVIKDDSVHVSGTRYELSSLDMSYFERRKHLTVNHSDNVENIVGNVIGLKKGRKRVTIDGIKFAVKENPALASFVMDMIKGGFITDFSTETYGPWPEGDDMVFKNARLMGLSVVVGGNNENATLINQVALNSLKKAKDKGLDISRIEAIYPQFKKTLDKNIDIPDNDVDMLVTIKNTRNFAVEIEYVNAVGDTVKTTLQPNATIDVKKDQEDSINKQLKDAVEPKKDTKADDEDNNVDSLIKDALKPYQERIDALTQAIKDGKVNEPQFVHNKNGKTNNDKEFDGMDYQEIHSYQILNAWNGLKSKNSEALNNLRKANEYNLNKLKEAKKVRNQMTIADFGSFVISPELLTDIEGFRSDFKSVLGLVSFRETLSQQFAYLTRSGDIDMEEVEFCDDDADGNLKPVSTYEATQTTGTLNEVAAVTPVCNAATRFLAVDMLADIAEGYRTDYDRKKAQLLVTRLQQAVNTTGYKVPYSGTSDTTTLQSWANLFAKISERIGGGGIAILNENSRWELVKRALGAGISGPLAGLLMTGDLSPIFGKNYVVVPNELLPDLNSGGTKSFTVGGTTVTIDQAVFFFQPRTFTGRISGGLQYDFSTDAAYEISGTVYSAYQRNELVLRGSFFRGGAIRDPYKVSSLHAAGVS